MGGQWKGLLMDDDGLPRNQLHQTILVLNEKALNFDGSLTQAFLFIYLFNPMINGHFMRKKWAQCQIMV